MNCRLSVHAPDYGVRMVEAQCYKPKVAGSSPDDGTYFFKFA
jgi:hypothetical protein